MRVDYDALVQKQSTEILLRRMLGDLAPAYTAAELEAGVNRLYRAVLETPIEASNCYCPQLRDDDICDACFDEAMGLNTGK